MSCGSIHRESDLFCIERTPCKPNIPFSICIPATMRFLVFYSYANVRSGYFHDVYRTQTPTTLGFCGRYNVLDQRLTLHTFLLSVNQRHYLIPSSSLMLGDMSTTGRDSTYVFQSSTKLAGDMRPFLDNLALSCRGSDSQ